MSIVPPGLGEGTWDHERPFQCRMKGTVLGDAAVPPPQPTAHAFFAEIAETPDRKFPFPGSGLAVLVQLMPFSCGGVDALSLVRI